MRPTTQASQRRRGVYCIITTVKDSKQLVTLYNGLSQQKVAKSFHILRGYTCVLKMLNS